MEPMGAPGWRFGAAPRAKAPRPSGKATRIRPSFAARARHCLRLAAAAAALLPARGLPGQEGRTPPVVCIIGAMAGEIRPIREEMRDAVERRIMGIVFYDGRLRGARVVVAESGVGKVNAAMATTLAIEHFHPRGVIFTGTAGGLNPALRPGDVVVGTRLVHHDLGDCTPAGFLPWGTKNPVDGKRNPVFFDADPSLVAAVEMASRPAGPSPPDAPAPGGGPAVVKGVIATGDAFIRSAARGAEIRKQFGADAVEMEGAACAQICRQHGVPFVAIRAVSDNPGWRAAFSAQPFFNKAAANSAALVIRTVEVLERTAADRDSRPGIV